jgi:hypothetical protein
MKKEIVVSGLPALVTGLATYIVSSQAALGVLLCLGAAILLALYALISRKKVEDAARQRSASIVWATAALLIFAAGAANERLIAMPRAKKIAAACDQYRAKHGIPPVELAHLVPEYLPSVERRAKYTLMWSGFYYSGGVLFWVSAPFMNMPKYDVSTAKWGYIGAEDMPFFAEVVYGRK